MSKKMWGKDDIKSHYVVSPRSRDAGTTAQRIQGKEDRPILTQTGHSSSRAPSSSSDTSLETPTSPSSFLLPLGPWKASLLQHIFSIATFASVLSQRKASRRNHEGLIGRHSSPHGASDLGCLLPLVLRPFAGYNQDSRTRTPR